MGNSYSLKAIKQKEEDEKVCICPARGSGGGRGRSLYDAAPQVVEAVVVTEVEKVVTQEVEKVVTQEVEREVVVTATPEPEARQLEIFHWWTGPGEREAADAMFEALANAYPDIEVIENPVAGGGGVSHRVVLQGRMAAGIPPDTFQTLGGAELKAYVDGGALEPLDDLWEELGYADVIPGPLASAVSVDYVCPSACTSRTFSTTTWPSESSAWSAHELLMAAVAAIKVPIRKVTRAWVPPRTGAAFV